MGGISKQDTDGLKASHGSIGFTKVNAFNLRITLCYQSCLVPHNNAMFVLLVLEYPFGANHISTIFWPLNQSPYFIALEVVQFFMHGLKTIRIFKSFIYLLRFNHGDIGMVIAEIC